MNPSLARNVVSFALLLTCLPTLAQQSIKVLWYRYADPTSQYTRFFSELAPQVQAYEKSSATLWQLTYFGPGDPTPDFSQFDVLVIESGEAFLTGPNLGTTTVSPDYSGILDNKAAIQAARGDRTIISATDGDFHAMRGDSFMRGDSPGAPAGDRWDGARGHLVNLINWAGSGNGLGIVSWCDCEFSGSSWWEHPDSFLRDELLGRVQYFRDNSPIIPAGAESLYLNYGLTSAGLSNWTNSFHAGFQLPVPGYTAVINSTGQPGFAVTIASSATAEQPAGPNPLIEFVANSVSVDEAAGTATLQVRRSANSIGAVSVTYATQNANAVSTADYTLTQGTLSFSDRETGPKTIAVPITNDQANEGAESFTVQLASPTGGAALATASASVTIQDNDAASGGGGGGGGGCAMATKPSSYDPTLWLLACGAGLALQQRRSRMRG